MVIVSDSVRAVVLLVKIFIVQGQYFLLASAQVLFSILLVSRSGRYCSQTIISANRGSLALLGNITNIGAYKNINRVAGQPEFSYPI